MNDILAILSGGDYVSGEKISQELGISRAAVVTASSPATASTPFSG